MCVNKTNSYSSFRIFLHKSRSIWCANWRETNILDTNFNTDDIYILIEKYKNEKTKKEKLIEKIIDYFNTKHELINQVFLNEK